MYSKSAHNFTLRIIMEIKRFFFCFRKLTITNQIATVWRQQIFIYIRKLRKRIRRKFNYKNHKFAINRCCCSDIKTFLWNQMGNGKKKLFGGRNFRGEFFDIFLDRNAITLLGCSLPEIYTLLCRYTQALLNTEEYNSEAFSQDFASKLESLSISLVNLMY